MARDSRRNPCRQTGHHFGRARWRGSQSTPLSSPRDGLRSRSHRWRDRRIARSLSSACASDTPSSASNDRQRPWRPGPWCGMVRFMSFPHFFMIPPRRLPASLTSVRGRVTPSVFWREVRARAPAPNGVHDDLVAAPVRDGPCKGIVAAAAALVLIPGSPLGLLTEHRGNSNDSAGALNPAPCLHEPRNGSLVT